MKTGFIGYGHMGGILLEALLDSGALNPAEIVVSTRTRSKLEGLQARHPTIEISDGNLGVAESCDRIFLCVGTYQVRAVLAEIGNRLAADTHLVLISGGLEMAEAERVHPGALTRIIPTLFAQVGQGTTLVCHNDQVPGGSQKQIRAMLERIGAVREIPETEFETAGVLTSCAPGLLAAICEQFALAAAQSGGIDPDTARAMILESLLGTAKLLRETGESFPALTARVATPGGATEDGAEILNTRLPAVFAQMFAAVQVRYEIRKQKTRRQFRDEG